MWLVGAAMRAFEMRVGPECSDQWPSAQREGHTEPQGKRLCVEETETAVAATSHRAPAATASREKSPEMIDWA